MPPAKIPYPIDSGNGTEYPSQYILMETFPEQPYDTTQDIPLAAFTTGLVRPMDFEGRKSLWIDFCGLTRCPCRPQNLAGTIPRAPFRVLFPADE